MDLILELLSKSCALLCILSLICSHFKYTVLSDILMVLATIGFIFVLKDLYHNLKFLYHKRKGKNKDE